MRRLAVVCLCLFAVFGLASMTAADTQDAILYKIEDGVLDYNVVHSADISGARIIDTTFYGITTLEKLTEVMGTPDAPEPVHGADTGVRTLGKAVTANLEFGNNNKSITRITITDVRDRPVVGISWKNNSVGSDYIGFAEAFERNGALAVFLPQVTTAAEAVAVFSKLDGIFVTGGEDWNPSLYGEEQTPHGSSGWNDARDTSDIHMMQQAIELDVPILMVCRGEQGFNVAMGGGLIQDIPYYLGQKVSSGEINVNRVTAVLEDTGYRKWDSATGTYVRTTAADCDHYRVQVDGLVHSGGTAYHKLSTGLNSGIDPNSKWLYDIIGSTSLEFVATAHHQAADPDNLGEGLTIVARSTDGIVEAVEHQDSLFALAVQWHPERDALRDTRGVGLDLDECNALLRSLVRYANIYAGQQIPTPVPTTVVNPTILPTMTATSTTEPYDDGDGGGCSAVSYLAFALLGVVPFVVKRK